MTAATALLMVDMQNMYLKENQPRRDVFGWPPIWRFDEVVKECQLLLAAARDQRVPVIYTQTGGRPDRADAMPSMRRLLASLPQGAPSPLSSTPSPILEAVAPQP
ncbi:MAG: isochorismatase family protein, partial [Chloroflexi bacterium]|nr:isochorismatase family protein [Chloroflexota bacterium]